VTRRILLWLPAALVLLAASAAGYLVWMAKTAEPDYAGQVSLKGLTEAVRVRFGPHAVPTIEAATLDDLIFAQGYVTAAERMWQMDLMRRLAGGRLAEVFGEDALPTDRFLRTVGLAEAARRAFADLEPRYRDLLRSYAAGVNAYRDRAAGRLPLEYRIAGFAPDLWRPEDSLAIGEYMAWMLSLNLREELVFLRLARRLGNRRAAELFMTDEGIPAPALSPDLPELTGMPDRAGLTADPVAFDALLAMPARWGLPSPGPASNAWAVTGARTADRAALLANDPHLGAGAPALWYELELSAPGLHAAGVALSGIPLILIGHNQDLAWGFTTAMADTQDLFLERPTPDGRAVERADGMPEPVATRVERIHIKGREQPLELAVRSTRNGVIANGILGREGESPMALPGVATPYLLALRTNLDVPDRAFAGIFGLNVAKSLEEARRASRDLRHASQNAMLAHRDGGIAWQVTGLLPRRGRGLGFFPSPGWVAGYGWTGYVPQSDNPGLTNPTGEALVTANDRTIPTDYPVNVGQVWMAPYRAQRIVELLTAAQALTPRDMARMQMDRVCLLAGHYQQALRRLEPELRAHDPEAWRIAEILLAWDRTMDGGSRAAALSVLLQPALYQALYGDELGDDLPSLMTLHLSAYTSLEETVRTGRSGFWDDVGTPETEGPAEIWGRALRGAWGRLQSFGQDPKDQQLARVRPLTFTHALDRVPILGRLFDVGPIGVGGGDYTVNVMKGSPNDPLRPGVIPSMRVVFTPADWGGTRGVLPLGQSGHRLSPYREDQLADWLVGDSHPWPWDGPAPGREIGTLTLQPAP
jgi:penicillin amidase